MDLIIVWVAILVLGGMIAVTKWAFPKKVGAGLSLASALEVSQEEQAAVSLSSSGLPIGGEQSLFVADKVEEQAPGLYRVVLKPSSRYGRRLPRRLCKSPVEVEASGPRGAKARVGLRYGLGTRHFVALRLTEVSG